MPAQVPEHGRARRGQVEDGVAQPPAVDELAHRRRLATGQDEARETLEVVRAGARGRARRRSSRASPACSAKAPWTARTPIVTMAPLSGADLAPRLPAADREPLLLGDRCDARGRASAQPRPRETSAMMRGSSKMRRGLHDGVGRRRRILGLEDARADEDALGAQLHRQGRIRRRGDAAGDEVDDRQPARRRRPRRRARTARRAPWRRRRARRGASPRERGCRR